jgi:hypothetical protein
MKEKAEKNVEREITKGDLKRYKNRETRLRF